MVGKHTYFFRAPKRSKTVKKLPSSRSLRSNGKDCGSPRSFLEKEITARSTDGNGTETYENIKSGSASSTTKDVGTTSSLDEDVTAKSSVNSVQKDPKDRSNDICIINLSDSDEELEAPVCHGKDIFKKGHLDKRKSKSSKKTSNLRHKISKQVSSASSSVNEGTSNHTKGGCSEIGADSLQSRYFSANAPSLNPISSDPLSECDDAKFLMDLEKSICDEGERLCPCCKHIVESSMYSSHLSQCLSKYKNTSDRRTRASTSSVIVNNSGLAKNESCTPLLSSESKDVSRPLVSVVGGRFIVDKNPCEESDIDPVTFLEKAYSSCAVRLKQSSMPPPTLGTKGTMIYPPKPVAKKRQKKKIITPLSTTSSLEKRTKIKQKLKMILSLPKASGWENEEKVERLHNNPVNIYHTTASVSQPLWLLSSCDKGDISQYYVSELAPHITVPTHDNLNITLHKHLSQIPGRLNITRSYDSDDEENFDKTFGLDAATTAALSTTQQLLAQLMSSQANLFDLTHSNETTRQLLNDLAYPNELANLNSVEDCTKSSIPEDNDTDLGDCIQQWNNRNKDSFKVTNEAPVVKELTSLDNVTKESNSHCIPTDNLNVVLEDHDEQPVSPAETEVFEIKKNKEVPPQSPASTELFESAKDTNSQASTTLFEIQPVGVEVPEVGTKNLNSPVPKEVIDLTDNKCASPSSSSPTDVFIGKDSKEEPHQLQPRMFGSAAEKEASCSPAPTELFESDLNKEGTNSQASTALFHATDKEAPLSPAGTEVFQEEGEGLSNSKITEKAPISVAVPSNIFTGESGVSGEHNNIKDPKTPKNSLSNMSSSTIKSLSVGLFYQDSTYPVTMTKTDETKRASGQSSGMSVTIGKENKPPCNARPDSVELNQRSSNDQKLDNIKENAQAIPPSDSSEDPNTLQFQVTAQLVRAENVSIENTPKTGNKPRDPPASCLSVKNLKRFNSLHEGSTSCFGSQKSGYLLERFLSGIELEAPPNDRESKNVLGDPKKSVPKNSLECSLFSSSDLMNKLVYDWSSLLASEENADVTLITKDSSIGVHSFVFMVRCKEIYNEIMSDAQPHSCDITTKFVLQWNFTHEVAYKFLLYIYTGQCSLSNECIKEIKACRCLAQQYKCTELLQFLEQHLQKRSSAKSLLDKIGQNSNDGTVTINFQEEEFLNHSGTEVFEANKRNDSEGRDSSSLLEEMFNSSNQFPAANRKIAEDKTRIWDRSHSVMSKKQVEEKQMVEPSTTVTSASYINKTSAIFPPKSPDLFEEGGSPTSVKSCKMNENLDCKDKCSEKITDNGPVSINDYTSVENYDDLAPVGALTVENNVDIYQCFFDSQSIGGKNCGKKSAFASPKNSVIDIAQSDSENKSDGETNDAESDKEATKIGSTLHYRTADASSALHNRTADASSTLHNRTADASSALHNRTADASSALHNRTADASSALHNRTADASSALHNRTADAETACDDGRVISDVWQDFDEMAGDCILMEEVLQTEPKDPPNAVERSSEVCNNIVEVEEVEHYTVPVTNKDDRKSAPFQFNSTALDRNPAILNFSPNCTNISRISSSNNLPSLSKAAAGTNSFHKENFLNEDSLADLEKELATDWSLSDVRGHKSESPNVRGHKSESPSAVCNKALHKRVKELLPNTDDGNRTPCNKNNATASSSFTVTPRPDYDSIPTPELKVNA